MLVWAPTTPQNGVLCVFLFWIPSIVLVLVFFLIILRSVSFLPLSFGRWMAGSSDSGKSNAPDGFLIFQCRPVVSLIFQLELHTVPAPSEILHILGQPSINLAVLPCEVFRSGLQIILWSRSSRCCRGRCSSDAVTVQMHS